MTSYDKAYVLKREFSHLATGVEVDAWLVEFPGWRNISWLLTKDYALPEQIEFNAIFNALRRTDFPANSKNWPLMSRKMLDALLSVGDFPHRTIPVVMTNCTLRRGKCVAIPGEEDQRYAIVQLLEHPDAFDRDKSVYKPDPVFPEFIGRIEKLVLKEPEGGFPPLFRLSAYSSLLLVSAEARMALEREGLQGIEFRDIANFGY